jgi:hypothetical protein
LEPSIGHQIGGFLSPLSFFFFLKVQIWIICLFFFGHDFQFEFLKTCSYNFL